VKAGWLRGYLLGATRDGRRTTAGSYGDHAMKISARNQLKGKVVAIDHGVTTSHVKIDIGGGVVVTSAITKASVEELKLEVGKQVYAIVKASDVMVGID
jgi:molybdopterin-binding protein